MKLTNEQINEYQSNGLLFIPNVFSADEVITMQNEVTKMMQEKTPDIVYEPDAKTIRALHGCHLRSTIYHNLTLQRRLVMPSIQLINATNIYLHQFKINIKSPFNGEIWPWHQDFTYWSIEDGLPIAMNLTAVVFLDEVNEFNAPTCFIPASHKEGNFNNLINKENDINPKNWIDNFTTSPKYTLDNELVASLIAKYGIVSGKGPAGSILFFNSNVVHASVQNISSYQRRLIYIAYNSMDNLPQKAEHLKRPDFLASTEYIELKSQMLDSLI